MCERTRQREIEKSKEEFLARLAIAEADNHFRLAMLTVYTPGATIRQVVNRALTGETGRPIRRY